MDTIAARMAAYSPGIEDSTEHQRAAVALVLRIGHDGPEMLFIERACRDGDPWSGQMAFPGGRIDVVDRGPADTAERETREEVGLHLAPAARLGRIDDVAGRRAGRYSAIVVSCYVYRVDQPAPLHLNYEVQSVAWVPCATLLDRRCSLVYHPAIVPGEAFPGLRVGAGASQVVWGLTYRFVEQFFRILDHPLPVAR